MQVLPASTVQGSGWLSPEVMTVVVVVTPPAPAGVFAPRLPWLAVGVEAAGLLRASRTPPGSGLPEAVGGSGQAGRRLPPGAGPRGDGVLPTPGEGASRLPGRARTGWLRGSQLPGTLGVLHQHP